MEKISAQATPVFQLQAFREFLPAALSLALQAGQVAMVSGVSGAGKTRLLRALADLDRNHAKVQMAGRLRDQFAPSEWRRQVAYIAAETAWWGSTVAEHFLADCPQQWLHRLNLSSQTMEWSVARLSSGEKQRLGLLRALVLRPRVLLLDEPTANLDECNTSDLETLVLEYLREQGAVAFWVSHTAAQRQRLGDVFVHITDSAVEVSE